MCKVLKIPVGSTWRVCKVRIILVGSTLRVCKVRIILVGTTLRVRKVRIILVGSTLHGREVRIIWVGSTLHMCKVLENPVGSIFLCVKYFPRQSRIFFTDVKRLAIQRRRRGMVGIAAGSQVEDVNASTNIGILIGLGALDNLISLWFEFLRAVPVRFWYAFPFNDPGGEIP